MGEPAGSVEIKFIVLLLTHDRDMVVPGQHEVGESDRPVVPRFFGSLEARLAISLDEIYKKAESLAGNVDDNFLELAKILRQLLDRDAEQFRALLEKSKLGSRKAYYLVNISRWFDGVKVGKLRLRNIGWTKLQCIGPYINAQNVDELILLAENNTAASLKLLMRGESPITNAHCVLLYFAPEHYSLLEEVLVKHGAVRNGRGLVDKEKALVSVLHKVYKMHG